MGLVSVVLAYLLGSISSSYWIGKSKGIDIRQHGSKNAGATNTLRVLGKVPAGMVLFLDALKGSVAVLVAMYLTNSDSLWVILSGLAAILGHNWPIFHGFKGGKGIATTIGMVAVLFFWPAVISGIMAIAIIFLFRYVSLGSLVFTTTLPFMLILFSSSYKFDYPLAYIYGGLAIATLSFFRHLPNLERLIKGEENRL